MKKLVKFWVEKRGFSLAKQTTERGTQGLILAFQNGVHLCAVTLNGQQLEFISTDSREGTTVKRDISFAQASADGITHALREACFNRHVDTDTVMGRIGQEWADLYATARADARRDATLADHLHNAPAYSFGLLFA